MTRDSLMQSNIERALQSTFNIRGHISNGLYTRKPGLEITGHAIASQDALELQELAREEGFKDVMWHFVSNSRWSCINFTKIKALWSNRCQQVLVNGVLYNILYGSWIDKEYHVAAMAQDVKIVIKPISVLNEHDALNETVPILIPHQTYYIVQDITSSVPALKFDKKQLECINPKNLLKISINRQGIYINRKFRDKIDVRTGTVDQTTIGYFELRIHHEDNIIFQEILGTESSMH